MEAHAEAHASNSVPSETPVAVGDPIVVPLAAEELTATTRSVDRGVVRVTTRVETIPATWEATLREDEVDVARVPIDQPVDVAPEPRWEGATLIVPVLAEDVVVTRRLILREEVRITRRVRTEPVSGTEPVRRQIVDVAHDAAAETDTEGQPAMRTELMSPSS